MSMMPSSFSHDETKRLLKRRPALERFFSFGTL